jgi:hypothetical protein
MCFPNIHEYGKVETYQSHFKKVEGEAGKYWRE